MQPIIQMDLPGYPGACLAIVARIFNEESKVYKVMVKAYPTLHCSKGTTAPVKMWTLYGSIPQFPEGSMVEGTVPMDPFMVPGQDIDCVGWLLSLPEFAGARVVGTF